MPEAGITSAVTQENISVSEGVVTRMPAFNLRDLGILICLTARVIDKKL